MVRFSTLVLPWVFVQAIARPSSPVMALTRSKNQKDILSMNSTLLKAINIQFWAWLIKIHRIKERAVRSFQTELDVPPLANVSL